MAATQDAQTVELSRPKGSLPVSPFKNAPSKTEYQFEPGAPVGRTAAPRETKIEARHSQSENAPLAINANDPAVGEVNNEGESLLSGGLKTDDAVVTGITEISVTLNCLAPAGRVLVSFPLSIIPSNLLRFGQPVRLSTDRSSGYRVPRIEARTPNRVVPLEGEDEISEWIARL
jgi:hypothetical protein